MAGLATATCPFKASPSRVLPQGHCPSARPPPSLALRSAPPGGALTAVLTASRVVSVRGRRFRRTDPNLEVDSDAAALDLDSITSTSVRLIDENKNVVGIVSKNEAIRMADDADMDLVIMSADADPPVVKIMDYSKYKYEKKKKRKGNLKKAEVKRRSETKQVKMGFRTDDHDYSVRLKAAQKFLEEGDKVKVVITLRGRENRFKNEAVEIFKRFMGDVSKLAKLETKDYSGKTIFIVLTPSKSAKGEVQPKEPPAPVEERAPTNEHDALILQRFPPGSLSKLMENQNMDGNI